MLLGSLLPQFLRKSGNKANQRMPLKCLRNSFASLTFCLEGLLLRNGGCGLHWFIIICNAQVAFAESQKLDYWKIMLHCIATKYIGIQQLLVYKYICLQHKM